MTVGQLAGMIAAIALVVLVIAVIWFLVQVVKSLNEAMKSVTNLTDQAMTLSKQADQLLQNTNELLADLNDKAEKVDPAFVAVGDVGQSISDLNEASRQLFDHASKRRAKRNQWPTKLGEAVAMGIFSHLKKQRNKE